jgi:hypothetical protein
MILGLSHMGLTAREFTHQVQKISATCSTALVPWGANCFSPNLNITRGDLWPLTLPSPRRGEGRVRGIFGEYFLQRLGLLGQVWQERR